MNSRTYVALPCLCRTVPAAPATRPAPAFGLLLPPTVVWEAGAGILKYVRVMYEYGVNEKVYYGYSMNTGTCSRAV